jgi:xylan 1,4-beta-xylosidase
VFRMFGMMKGQRVSVASDGGLNVNDIISEGVRKGNDVHAIASKDQHSISVMVWNYHDDNIANPPSPIDLTISGINEKKVLVHHYRVDHEFSNSFEAWKAMGKPHEVVGEQYRALEWSGQLQLYTSPQWMEAADGNTVLKFDLPRQGVSLIQLTW